MQASNHRSPLFTFLCSPAAASLTDLRPSSSVCLQGLITHLITVSLCPSVCLSARYSYAPLLSFNLTLSQHFLIISVSISCCLSSPFPKIPQFFFITTYLLRANLRGVSTKRPFCFLAWILESMVANTLCTMTSFTSTTLLPISCVSCVLRLDPKKRETIWFPEGEATRKRNQKAISVYPLQQLESQPECRWSNWT